MRNRKFNYLLWFVVLFSIQLYADADYKLWFLMPSHKQPVTGTIEVKIYPPHIPINVIVWIESKRTKQIVWMGELSAVYDYTINVDTTRFNPGPYEINAQYYFDDDEVEGDIDIWVNAP
ncbi:MAG: hypothetical protein ACRCTQ_02650 [Brevinemataceae bacterium]